MIRNSFFIAASENRVIRTPSFYPLDNYINRLRNLLGPLALFIAWWILFKSAWFLTMMNLAWLPLM
jgi:hypothetical protein